jgi:hypothetical protein
MHFRAFWNRIAAWGRSYRRIERQEPATSGAPDCDNGPAFSLLRFQAVVSCPAFKNAAAIAEPIAPQPITVTSFMFSFLCIDFASWARSYSFVVVGASPARD